MSRRDDTLGAWLAEHPPAPGRFAQSAAAVAVRVLGGEGFHHAVRELLDEIALAPDDGIVARAIVDKPPPTGNSRLDAYLGALAEHLAISRGLTVPPWTIAGDRFLDRFWFVSEVQGFRATAIAQSPAAFRRRGVFIAAGSLRRV
ncbi:MAG: hypothetical protein M3Z33_11335 [Actinomycetota bacterium]|nr:hypothetical protein [Actinomycetota bacterium]